MAAAVEATTTNDAARKRHQTFRLGGSPVPSSGKGRDGARDGRLSAGSCHAISGRLLRPGLEARVGGLLLGLAVGDRERVHLDGLLAGLLRLSFGLLRLRFGLHVRLGLVLRFGLFAPLRTRPPLRALRPLRALPRRPRAPRRNRPPRPPRRTRTRPAALRLVGLLWSLSPRPRRRRRAPGRPAPPPRPGCVPPRSAGAGYRGHRCPARCPRRRAARSSRGSSITLFGSGFAQSRRK